MSIARWQPLSDLRRMREDMDRLFESMSVPDMFAPMETARPFPAVDVFEKDNNIVVKAEVPGLKKDDLEVAATEEAISLKGEFKQEEETKEGGYVRREMRTGKFFRSIPLPSQIKPDEARASFRDGILEITAPMAEQVQTREKRVEIQG